MDEKTGNSLVHLPRVRLSVIVCLSRLFFLALIWSVEFDAACRPILKATRQRAARG